MTLTVQDRILGSRGKMLELQSQWSFISFSFSLQGVCLGMQLAVVEFSRNVLGWQGEYILGLGFLHDLCWREAGLILWWAIGSSEEDA